MRLETRKLLDKAFTGAGYFSTSLMLASVVILLAPIFVRGISAIVFQGTIEHLSLIHI